MTTRMIPIPDDVQEAIGRNLELGREWRAGHDDGYEMGYRHGITSTLCVVMIFVVVALFAYALVTN